MDQLSKTTIGEEYISQVRTFGALGYTPERILTLLQLTGVQKAVLRMRIQDPTDTYGQAYIAGRAMGEFNVDAELAKKAEKGDIEAIQALSERQHERKVQDLQKKLFGI